MLLNNHTICFLLLLNIGISWVIRRPIFLANPRLRKWASTLAGLTLVWTVAGSYTFPILFSIVLQTILIKTVPWKHLNWVSFVAGFVHLSVLRFCGPSWLSFTARGTLKHTDSIQMMLTLKMIGVAFEMTDSVVRKLQIKNGKQQDVQDLNLQIKHRSVEVQGLDLFHYGLGHAGMLCGMYLHLYLTRPSS